MPSVKIFLLAAAAALTASCAAQSIAPPHAATVSKDLSYAPDPASTHAKQKLDIRAPKPAAKAPVVMMIHGGAWAIGDKGNANSGVDSPKASFFTAAGNLYVSINYRLSPEVSHPEHVRDVAMAIDWVHRHIAAYGGDPDRLFLVGHSAGAHLAALVAIDPRYLREFHTPPECIRGVVLLDGAGYDIPRQYRKLWRVSPLKRWYREAFTEDEAKQREASPVTQVSPGHYMPPFLMLYVSRREDAKEQNELLSAALLKCGVKVKVVPVDGKTHATINREIGVKDDIVSREITRFISTTR